MMIDFWSRLKSLHTLFNPMRGRNRQFERNETKADVRLFVDGETKPGHLVNVSANGCLVAPPLGLVPGTSVSLVLTGQPVKSEAVVVREIPAGTALQFAEPGCGAILSGWSLGVGGGS